MANSALALAVMLLLALPGESQSGVLSEVVYSVDFDLADNHLQALVVTVEIQTVIGRIEAMEIPNGYSKRLSELNLRVTGGTVITEAPSSVIHIQAASTNISLRYELPVQQSESLFADEQAPVIQPHWLAAHGRDILPVPLNHASSMAVLNVAAPPSDWTQMANSNNSLPLQNILDTFLLGGAQYRMLTRDLDGAPIAVYFPLSASSEAERILKDAANVLSAERHLWRSEPTPFQVGLIALRDDEDFSGRGINGGFALYLGKNVQEPTWLRLIAHENLHAWISRKIGGFPARDADSEAWLNEGFTEAYTARILLEAGLWSIDDFVADWNISLARYGTSPVATAPNARIQAERQNDFDVNRLPYDRGRILAILWDDVIRSRTHGRLSLDQILRQQMEMASKSSSQSASADVLFPAVVKTMTGFDLGSQLDRYVQRGERLKLQMNAFGPCVIVTAHTQPAFDRGFDLPATLSANRHVTGLEAGGPAERAGLHADDKIAIDEVPTHDSRTVLTYRVTSEDGQSRVISYHPEGTTQVTFQQLALTQKGHMYPAECRKSLSRP